MFCLHFLSTWALLIIFHVLFFYYKIIILSMETVSFYVWILGLLPFANEIMTVDSPGLCSLL